MALPTVTALPTAPSRQDDSATFVSRADAFLGALPTFRTELNALGEAIVVANSAANYNSTSSTSLAIGTGSKTLTVETGKLYAVGGHVIVSSTASPTNYMAGQVTAYSTSTGALTVNVTVVGGSGTYGAWTVTQGGPVGATGAAGGAGTFVELTGGTMTGPLITDASEAGAAGLNVPPGTAPSSPSNGDIWTTAAGIFARIAGATLDLLSKAGGTMTGALVLTTDSTVKDSGGTGYKVGYRGMPINAQNGNYTLALTDAGKRVYSKNTGTQAITIPANSSVAFVTDDTVISICGNGTTSRTIVPATGVTLIWGSAGTSGTGAAGTRTLAAKSQATIHPVETDVWMIDGTGIS